MNRIAFFVLTWIITYTHAQTLVWSGKCHSQQRETYGVAFSPDGQHVVSGSECHPASVRLWNAANGNLIWDYNVGNVLMCQMGVKMSASGNYICSMEEAGNLIVLQNNGSSPQLLYTLNVGSGGSHSVDISPDEKWVVVDGNNNKAKIYRISDGALHKTLSGHTGDVVTVCFSPDGSKLVTGSADNTAKLWDATGALLHTFPSLGSKVVSARFSADGSKVVLASLNGKIVVYNMTSFAQLTTFQCPEKVNQISVSSDGNLLVAACDTSARCFLISSGQNIATFNTPNGGKVYSVDIAPNLPRAVIGNSNGDVAVYDLGSITGTTGLTPEQVVIYPNPTRDYLQIGGISDEFTYGITRADGSLIRQGRTFGNTAIDLSGMHAGVYQVNIISRSNSVTKTFVILTQ
ncbi:MAG: T9SS type A sorting domain-containing protein [Chitinophagales bacterium]|nr:T9SS type A sorting domain-containing protein [Chitinophagales bacterium]